jgi:1,4-alpha-glucan branching enzyme
MPAVTPERQPIERLVRGEHHEPHRLLGAHLDGDRVTIRAWRPDATGVVALIGDDRVMLTKIHPAGLFEVVLPRSDIPAYRLEVAYGDRSFTVDDPYRFLPTIGEIDEHLVGEATHERLWESSAPTS